MERSLKGVIQMAIIEVEIQEGKQRTFRKTSDRSVAVMRRPERQFVLEGESYRIDEFQLPVEGEYDHKPKKFATIVHDGYEKLVLFEELPEDIQQQLPFFS